MKRIVLLALLLWPLPLAGEFVDHLYEARVPLTGRTAEAEQQALKEAYKQVVVKLTGLSRAAEHPEVLRLLEAATRNVDEFSYVELAHSDDGLSLTHEPAMRVRFNASWLQTALKGAGLPLWQAERPTLLVWMVLDTGETDLFATPQTSPAAHDLLEQVAWRRGLGVQVPDYEHGWTAQASADLHDLALQQPESTAEVRAVIRYRFTGIGLSGSALFQDDHNRYRFQAGGETMGALLEELVGRFADAYSAERSYISADGEAHGLDLEVIGVGSYADYRDLLDRLRKFEMVQQLQVLRVQPRPDGTTSLFLRLRHDADDDYALRTLATVSRLAPLAQANRFRLLPRESHAPG